MSKAEERALEKFPILFGERMGYDKTNLQQERRNAFEKGYHQAEKDLLANKHEKSWRLDEKLWKRIKDVEEASYQYTYDASNDWAYDIPTWDDVQDAFKAGSEWKEDLELTWKDIEKITDIWDDLHEDEAVYSKTGCDTPEFYQEVLKQFKESKNKINKNE